MIFRKEKIEKTLEWLDERYKKLEERYDDPDSSDTYTASADIELKESRFYSKLAILELSGWVEGSIDALVQNLADRKSLTNDARERFKKAVKSTRGFDYENHFLELLHKVIGIIDTGMVEENINNNIDGTLENFKSTLNSLYKSRNRLAHTFSQEMQEQIDSPSNTRDYYKKILAGLERFEEEIATNQNVRVCSPEA